MRAAGIPAPPCKSLEQLLFFDSKVRGWLWAPGRSHFPRARNLLVCPLSGNFLLPGCPRPPVGSAWVSAGQAPSSSIRVQDDMIYHQHQDVPQLETLPSTSHQMNSSMCEPPHECHMSINGQNPPLISKGLRACQFTRTSNSSPETRGFGSVPGRRRAPVTPTDFPMKLQLSAPPRYQNRSGRCVSQWAPPLFSSSSHKTPPWRPLPINTPSNTNYSLRARGLQTHLLALKSNNYPL